MTKADIVSEISKSTGIDKTDSVEQRRIFYGYRKKFIVSGRKRIPERFWKFRD